MNRQALLACGVLSSLLYAAMNVIVAMQWEAYSSVTQTVSELSAIGAPTRPLWVTLGFAYALLVTAFGWGVWRSAHGDRRLRIAGAALIAYGLLGFGWPLAPMHLRGEPFSLTDAMHIAFSAVTITLMLFAIGFGAAALGRRFRLYSLATTIGFLVFGALTGREAPRIADDLPTPTIGIWERLNIGLFLLWVIALAVVLLLRQRSIPRSLAA